MMREKYSNDASNRMQINALYVAMGSVEDSWSVRCNMVMYQQQDVF